jgi:glycosyltransferase involved in cell wall biosynthesis
MVLRMGENLHARQLLSVVVPVYNEEAHLTEFVRYLMQSKCPVPREFIFVDDKSSDKSVLLLKKLQADFEFVLLEQSENHGKGAAVVRGIDAAKGQLIMIQDADFEYDTADVPSLIAPILDNEADVVFGSRFKKTAVQVHRTYHYFVNRFLTVVSNLFSGLYLTDMETCYKIFRADLLKPMNLVSKRFGVEVELTAYVAKSSARVFELPIRYYPRTRLHGKKINWRDGLAALWHLFYFNFLRSYRDAFRGLPIQYSPVRAQPYTLQDNRHS